MSEPTPPLDVNGKLAVVGRDLEYQTKTLDRIEATLKEQKTDSDKRFADLTQTVKGWIDHETGNRKSAVQALETKVQKDLEDNQRLSDERLGNVMAEIASKADKSDLDNVAKEVGGIKGHINQGVWIVLGAVILAMVGWVVVDPTEKFQDLIHRQPEPVVQHVATPPAQMTSTVTVQPKAD